MRKLLDFNPNGLIKIHFLTKDINFPVAIAVYSAQEDMMVSCLSNNIKSGNFNTESICIWCDEHKIEYQIVYPLRKIMILKNPYKYYRFLCLKKKLNCYSKK